VWSNAADERKGQEYAPKRKIRIIVTDFEKNVEQE
jgi:hypothetical protein